MKHAFSSCSVLTTFGYDTLKSNPKNFFLNAGTFADAEQLLEFAKLGCYCEYDLFGIETSHYQLWQEADMPSDAQRIIFIKNLLDNGYRDKILVAHDIHTKHRLVRLYEMIVQWNLSVSMTTIQGTVQ